MTYTLPAKRETPSLEAKTAYLVASGDLRESANVPGWPVQRALEQSVAGAFERFGWTVRRANPVDPVLGHGFIRSQRMGLEVFKDIPPTAPLIVAEAVWQYSHHVLAGLRTHRGPILTVANFAPDWPGLVGLLGLNAGLTKMGVEYSTIWSVDFDDAWFLDGIRSWIETGRIEHDASHVRPLPELADSPEKQLGEALADQLLADKAIMGIFDEGCMGMYNAIIDDELINSAGIYKERLSQSALVAKMRTVSDVEAQAARKWLDDRGMTFKTGPNPETDLTDDQILEQMKMYIAAVRIAAEFGCSAVGIQYQQGLKDMVPASDLVEGLLNNVERPPVYDPDTGAELYAGKALPCFNEVDECAAVDSVTTNRVWTAMGFDPATTLHDLRFGEHYKGDGVDDFVWVFEISGAIPASHIANGYAGASSERQPPMYFRLGGGSLKGISKPGEVVWSRVFVMGGKLHVDLGRATAVELPLAETERRWQDTTPQWPIMHGVLHGVSRDQMMARHRANHLNVVYAPSAAEADKALAAKAAMFAAMGLQVHFCGDVKL